MALLLVTLAASSVTARTLMHQPLPGQASGAPGVHLRYRVATLPTKAPHMQMAALGLALFIGMLLPLQALINASLGKQTTGPLFASLSSFAVGSVVLLAWWLATRPAFDWVALVKVPWWAWPGGLIGAVFVAGSTMLIPQMGAAALICAVVFGQVAGSLLLDHFGVLHARTAIDPLRIVGALLVVAGALLVVRPWNSA